MGHYIQRNTVLREHPQIVPEWDKWLEDNADPGHYDCYDDFSSGKKEFAVDTFMPAHLWERCYGNA